jgi:hypothetical protein
MRAGGELDWLQESIECCSKSAVAYKAAFMLARDPCLEKRLLARCADRYALLERLLNLLGEQGAAPERMRAMLDGIDSDPARHGRLKTALEEAVACDQVARAHRPSRGARRPARRPRGVSRQPASIAATQRDARPARRRPRQRAIARGEAAADGCGADKAGAVLRTVPTSRRPSSMMPDGRQAPRVSRCR